MIGLIERIRQRLVEFSYVNEASISHGVVMPVLQQLGWDTADRTQLVPEFTVERRRVDFALLGAGRKPSVFVEVKGQGLAAHGDRQLFEYAFHEGVPLCVLTDGAEWNFYLPSAQGSYDDRRVYRLQLDERSAAESEHVLRRYLQRERVRSGAAYEDAQRDYRAAASRREAITILPNAWRELLAEPDATLVSVVSDKAESMCGFRPTEEDVMTFLADPGVSEVRADRASKPAVAAAIPANPASSSEPRVDGTNRGIDIVAVVFGEVLRFTSAKDALVGILRTVTSKDPSRLPDLAAAVRGRERNQIARSAREIHPERPDLARAVEFTPGWVVDMHLSNRQKARILKALAKIYELPPEALRVELPNA